MDKNEIEEIAYKFSTNYLRNYTGLSVDSIQHFALTQVIVDAIKEFTINVDSKAYYNDVTLLKAYPE